MNINLAVPAWRDGTCRRFGAGVAALVALSLQAADAPAPAASPAATEEDKPFTMYMGSDFSIEHNDKLHTVQDVTGTNFVISIKGRETTVPMTAKKIRMNFDQSLKIAPRLAKIEGLVTDRGYTPANDPYRKFAAQAGGAGTSLASLDLANYNQQNAQRAFNNIQGESHAPGWARQQAQDNLDSANANLSSAMEKNNFSTQYNAGDMAARLSSELSEKLFDAVTVDFSISSDVFLDRPYIVIIARYREKGGKPDSARNWIYAKALDPIGKKPSKIHILQGGMPPGFEMDDCQIRIYNRGKEIATNEAPKRVAVTLEEAFDYLLISYLKRNKAQTLLASVAVGRMPENARKLVNPVQWQRSYHAKVPKDGGAAREVFLDEQCTQPAEPGVVALLDHYRFFPALEKGVPVEGTALVELDKLDI